MSIHDEYSLFQLVKVSEAALHDFGPIRVAFLLLNSVRGSVRLTD